MTEKHTLPDDVESFLAEVEPIAIASNADRTIRLIAIVREQAARISTLTKQRDEEAGLSNFRSYEIGTWKAELAESRTQAAALRDRLARAESAELALLDLRRIVQSDLEPSNELGAKLLVQSVVERLARLDKLAKLPEELDDLERESDAEAAKERVDNERVFYQRGYADGIARAAEEMRELLEAKDGTQ